MQHVDLFTWLRGDILVKADKMTMANSLELRVPFLDPEVFAVASRLSRGGQDHPHPDPGRAQLLREQLRAAGVDAIEDVDDDVDRLVRAGDRLDVELLLEHVAEPGDPVDVLGKPLAGHLCAEQGVHGARTVDEEGGDVHPACIPSTNCSVELERLGLDVEPEPGERVGVAVEERRGSAADDAVEGGDPLLTVEEELLGTSGRATTHGLPAPLGFPDQQCPDGEAVGQHLLHQPADLGPGRHVAALELG